jgi:hypothetical protein
MGNAKNAARIGCIKNRNMSASERICRTLIAEIIGDCDKSREQIAEQMSERLGQTITTGMLNDFSAFSKGGARFPIWFVGAFCEVTGSDRLQRQILFPHLRDLLTLGELETAREELKKKLRVGKVHRSVKRQ